MSVAGCPRCGQERHRGRCKKVKAAQAEPEIGPALRIDIAPGLGVSAWIENGCLQLAQGEDVVALSQTEARVLFAQFADWTEAA
ncbi:MAG: hypothetical protein U1F09_13005 [Steroidobacteraceae bacterium]